MKNLSTKVMLCFVLTFGLIFQFSARSYAQNLFVCSTCHSGPGGHFSSSPVDLTACKTCHDSPSMDTSCVNGATQTIYGYFLGDPSSSNGAALHNKHAGTNAQANDAAACGSCHFRADCGTCHSAVNHDLHYGTTYIPKNIKVATGTSVENKDINCANALCHNTVETSSGSGSRVLALDGQTMGSITVNAGDNPRGAAVNNVTNRIYIANYNSNTISIIDSDAGSASFNQVIGTISTGNNPYDVAVDESTNMIYVANTSDNTVSIINGGTNLVETAVNVGLYPKDIEVNSVTHKVYVSNYGNNFISVIDTVNGNQISNIMVNGIKPLGMCINSASNRVYAGVMRYSMDPAIKVYDIIVIDDLTPVATIMNTGIANDLVYNAANGYVYNATEGGILVINGSSLDVVNNIGFPGGIVVSAAKNPGTGSLYAGVINSDGSESLYVLNGSDIIENTIPLQKNTQKIRVNNNNGYIYTAGGVSTIVQEPKPSCFNCHTDISKHSDSFHVSNPDQTANEVCNMCHSQSGLPKVHSAFGWNCFSCHKGYGTQYGQTAKDVIYAYKTTPNAEKAGCQDCHPNVTVNELKEAGSLYNSAHVALHDNNPGGYGYTVCGLCHNQGNLPAVHLAFSRNCLACHQGTGPVGEKAVEAINKYSSDRIAANKSGCNDCHILTVTIDGSNSLQNGSHIALHSSNPKNYGNEVCNVCHGQVTLPAVHSIYNKDCLACHQGTGPVGEKAVEAINRYSSDRIEANKSGCSDCHILSVTVDTAGKLQNSNHIALHDPNPAQYDTSSSCYSCHGQTTLVGTHDASSWGCLSCHSGTGPNYGSTAVSVINAYALSGRTYNDKAGCQDCHPNVTGTKGSPASLDNANHYALHDSNPRQTENAVCNLCHKGTNLAIEHKNNNWKCDACHSGTGPNSGAAALTYIAYYRSITNPTYDNKAGCQDCHNSVTGTKGVPSSLANNTHITLHDPNPRQYNNDMCKTCHTQTNLPDVHTAANYNCLACHDSNTALGQKAKQIIAAYDSITNPSYADNAGCQDCHTTVTGTKGNDSSLSNSNHVALHIPNPASSSMCGSCHNTTVVLPELHKDINNGCLGCHSDTAWAEAKQAIAGYHANPVESNRAGCADCHGAVSHTCVTCHENQRNTRRPVSPEFRLSSHHVAGEVTPDDCLDCHDISLHGKGTVNLKNADGGIIAYDPNDASSMNPFCLGCHDADSKNTTPFSDGRKPVSSTRNWDSTDIDTKYSNTGTADSNKYPPTQTAPGQTLKYNTVPNEKKAYSPHGNPAANEPNGDASDKAVPCLDCHNAHGSSAPTLIKTTSEYAPASIEDFCWDCHLNDNNAPKKALDYMLNPDNNEVKDYYGDMRWGENSGGATGFKGDWMGAFTYKSGKFKSSHFYPSKKYDSLKTWQRSAIGCTDCHDVHGINSGLSNARYMVPALKGTWLVSPFKEDRTPQASFTSPMPDDVRTGEDAGNLDLNIKPRSRPSLDFNNPPNPGAGYANGTGGQGHEGYFIDENTFGASGNPGSITVNRISENDTTFAGLCLKCHTKTALTTAWNGHGVVKGWGGATKDIFTSSIAGATMAGGEEGGGNYRWGINLRSQESRGYIQKDYHQFACSKCHSPHASRLPRLMITDCLDNEGLHSPQPNTLSSTANNCHSTQRGNGFDTLVTWVQPAAPATAATVDSASLTPAVTNMLINKTAKLTFAAKNDKSYTLDYYLATFDVNYSGMNITNFVCNPPAKIAAFDSVNQTITLKWENINPKYTITASFDCGGMEGYYQINLNKTEYKDNNGNVVYGNCSEARVNIVNVIDTIKPSVPANLRGTALNCAQVNLTWTKSTDNAGGSGVAGYNIYRNSVLVGTAEDTTYTDSGLTDYTTYRYSVSAFDIAGNVSNQTWPISVTTPRDTIAPSVPANLRANGVTRNSINIIWDASTDNVKVAGYNIYRNGMKIGTSTTPNYTALYLSSNTIYRFKVSAYDARGNTSAATAEISIKTSY